VLLASFNVEQHVWRISWPMAVACIQLNSSTACMMTAYTLNKRCNH